MTGHDNAIIMPSFLEHPVIIFLDLEETLIDNWENGWLLPEKVNAIRAMCAPFNAKVGLMSWAVWDESDKVKFNTNLRLELEEALGAKFSDDFVWSMDDWAKQLLEFQGKSVSRKDLFDIFGKHEVLFMVSRCHPAFKGHNVILFDDAVEDNLSWHSKANDCKVLICNINEIVKR